MEIKNVNEQCDISVDFDDKFKDDHRLLYQGQMEWFDESWEIIFQVR